MRPFARIDRRRVAGFILASLFAAAAAIAPPAWAVLTSATKNFSPDSITAGETATLTVTIQNTPPGNPSSIQFTDDYPAGLTNAATPTTDCRDGTATGVVDGASLSLSGGSITGNKSCTVTVVVSACTPGNLVNPSFTVTSTSGSATSNEATLTVTAGPVSADDSTVVASPTVVPADGTTASTITVTLTDSCGNPIPDKTVTLSPDAGSSTITTENGITDASGEAAFTVRNTVAESVTYTATNTTDGITVTQTATVTFKVVAPTVSKGFSPTTILVNGTSLLSVTLTNTSSVAITGVAFTDDYPANLVNASTPGLSNTCGGTATGAAGATSLTLSGGTIAANDSCTVSVNVTSATADSYTNDTGPVTSSNAIEGASASATLTVSAVSDFNVVEPGADAVTGKIFTKIAGLDFALDIVALDDSNAVLTTFTGTVAVEVVDHTGGGACGGLPVIATFTDQTFVAGDNGRHALSAPNTETNAWRNAKMRVTYPVDSPAITACSGDNFAIRPESLSFSVTHADRTTAGTTEVLGNTTIPGGLVHNAGRSFTITATAFNGAGTPAVTSNYDGTPAAALTQCSGNACPASPDAAKLNLGTWSASGGTVTTTTASYADIGAFTLQLEDSTFAAVDDGDGTPPDDLTISSTATDVGRFVPDRFELSAASITPRSNIAGCSASSFTYMGEQMTLNFTLTAVDAGGTTMTRYAGALAHSNATSFNFGAIDSAAPTPLTARLDTAIVPAPAWSAGVLADFAAPVAITRDSAPDGSYESLRIGIAPSDPDAVALAPGALDLDADDDGAAERAQVGSPTAVRFGRLFLQNAFGSELLDLPMPMRAQYYANDTVGFVTHTEDNCTAIAEADLRLSNGSGSVDGAGPITVGSEETSATITHEPFASGDAGLSFSAPGEGGDGFVDVTLQPGVLPVYLQYDWTGDDAYDNDPQGRATFGIFKGNPRYIYRRERY